MEEKAILTDNNVFCPECNAILVVNSTGEKECPNGCELIEFLD